MAANVRVGEAQLLVQTTGVAAIANVRVGEAVFTVSGDSPAPTPANVRVGEAVITFDNGTVVPVPALVRVGEAVLNFGSSPVVPPVRTGAWCYRGGVMVPAFHLNYNAAGTVLA